jgi:hypothetical protein
MIARVEGLDRQRDRHGEVGRGGAHGNLWLATAREWKKALNIFRTKFFYCPELRLTE